MELLELVENEPTTRPFQCDWEKCTKSFNRKSDLQIHYRIHTNERPYACTTPGCGKSFIQRSALTVHVRTHTGEKPHSVNILASSSIARHRRIHTGERPYKCGHNGCLKCFCRKTTMAKHQRRSHQKGMNPNEPLDNCSWDSDSNESPSTPQTSSMTWSPQDIMAINSSMPHDALRRASSYPDLGQQMHDYALQQHQQYLGRQTIPSTVPPEFHPHTSNPGIATMTTNPISPQYQLAQQQVERPPIEMPYTTPGMAASIQSSRSAFSAASVQSPLMQDGGFYPPQQQHPPA
ncbi:hypothetical protein B0T10DRAFT_586073 [Thelonectria olida]|uniref:C2H2-type domain-containing protein n=1 Tax=Thelonectria olida TaxID=1576542 RepID=A0A9P9AIL1_9HYPO|nr:hypothetical protein B0T10DRAFT_586073 [Thelonectria olida]